MIATEPVPGQFTTPTTRIFVPYTASPGRGALQASQDATGGYDRTARVRRGFADPSATFGGPVSFEELAMLAPYAIKGGVTPVADGSGYRYEFAPTFDADDIATFSALFGVNGLPWQSRGNRFDEFNISGDATGQDNSWSVGGTPFLSDAGRYEAGDAEFTATAGTTTTITNTGAGWTVDAFKGAYIFKDYGSHIGEVRQVASNTAEAITVSTPFSEAVAVGDVFYVSAVYPTVTIPEYETIEFEGTQFFVDAYNASASSLGTTDISDRALSFNVTQTLALSNKRRASGVIGRKGRGAREITGTLRFEDDRWDEYAKWIADEPISLRIHKQGPLISGSTYHSVTIDIEKALLDVPTPDEAGTNMTRSYTFRAFLEAPIWKLTVVTDLATLP
jgi:hypothetical protein